MKKIVIFHENVDKIEFVDSDDTNLDVYSKKLSSVLELGNISILYTTSSSMILRPSKVISILIEELKDGKDTNAQEVENVDQHVSEEVDTITEGD